MLRSVLFGTRRPLVTPRLAGIAASVGLGLAAAVSPLFAAPAFARGPLDPRLVDSAAAWLVHVDIEAALRTDVGRFIAKALDIDVPGLVDLRTKLGIVPERDIKGLTIYGAAPGDEDGVAVLVSSSVVDRLPDRLIQAGVTNVEVIESNTGIVYAATIGGDRWYGSVRKASDPELRLVVMSRTMARLERAVGVITSPDQSLHAAPEHPLRMQAKSETFVVAAARGAQDEATAPKRQSSHIARNMRVMHMELGETAAPNGNEVYLDLAIEAGSSEQADTMQKIFQGGLAMAQLGAKDNRAISEAITAVRVWTDGETLRVTGRQTAKRVVEALEQMRDRSGTAAPQTGE